MKIGIVGCGGRMGQMLIREVDENKKLVLVGGTEISASSLLGKDLGLLSGGNKLGVLVESEPKNLFENSDVILDFTTPQASLVHVELAAKFKTALVIGTTGINEKQLELIKTKAKKTVVVHAANFSVGINLLIGLIEKATSILTPHYDIEVLEMHHRHKVDAPSGTALAFGEAAAKGAGVSLAKVSTRVRDGIIGKRTPGSIGFATLRGGSVIGEHTLIFAADGERVELSHKAADRKIFAAGAIRAALWTKKKPPGYYNMQDVLDFS